MAADLRLVMHAAEAHTHEFALHGTGESIAPSDVLPRTPGGPTKTNRRFALRRELAYREIFDDALLDLVQAVMILVQDAPRFSNVDQRAPLAAAPKAVRSTNQDRREPCHIRRLTSGIRSKRRNSLRTCSSTSLGICALVMASPSSEISAALLRSPPSPNCFCIARRSARAGASRAGAHQARSSFDVPISCDRRSTSTRRVRRRETFSILAATSMVSRSSCLSSGLTSI